MKKSNQQYHGRLNISENSDSIFIQGETFKYGFNKKSGLINLFEVLGDNFLIGMNSEIPDIYISDAINPKKIFYSAKYEDSAECEIIYESPYEVHVRSHGMYHNPLGDTFPVRYRITYEIQNDGYIFILVNNKAYESCNIRWLCISRGKLNPSLCRYYAKLGDLSKVDKTDNYTYKKISVSCEQNLFGGRFIPWFWLGNDRTGIEISIMDVTNYKFGATLIQGELVDHSGDIPANIIGKSSSSEVLWEVFSIRNAQTKVDHRWEQNCYFSLSPTPTKHYSTAFSGMSVYFAEHCATKNKYLSDSKIREISQMGFDVLITKFNADGQYLPDDENEIKRIISTCKEYGIKLIPYLSLMELNKDSDEYKNYGLDWRIEPYYDDEKETSLMCPAAEGWREYWKQHISKILQDYDFDGIYIDLSYDRLACRNQLHGCQRKYIRPTFLWVREMLRYAWVRTKRLSLNSLVMVNTGPLPISMICSWADIRCIGESSDIINTDEMMHKGVYNSYRLGCNNAILTGKKYKIDGKVIAYSLLHNAALIMSEDQNNDEIEKNLSYGKVFKAFGIDDSIWYPGFLDDSDKLVKCDKPDVFVNIHKHDSLLMTLVNISDKEVSTKVCLTNPEILCLDKNKQYIVYEPLAKTLFLRKRKCEYNELIEFEIDIDKFGSRILYIREYPENPVLLFSSGSKGVLDEKWDKQTDILTLKIATLVGSVVSNTIYLPTGKPVNIKVNETDTNFDWHDEQKLLTFDIKAERTITDISLQVIPF